MTTRALAALALLATLAAPARAAEEAPPKEIWLRAGRVLPVTSAPIERGLVVVRDGVIARVEADTGATPPPGAQVIDLPQAWLVPGLVDLHCHVAGTDINDITHPVNPDLTVLDTITPGNEELLEAVAGGVTTVLFIPGSGTNIGGFGALLSTYGRTLDEMVLRYPGAMKIAQAGNPERRSGEVGRGRLGMNWNIREALLEGRGYHEAWTRWESDPSSGSRPDRVPRLELMRGLFRKDFPVLVHTQWTPVFQSSIRMLHDEFGLWVVLSHTEFDSYAVSALAAARDMFVNVGPRSYHVDWDTSEVVGLAARHHENGVRRVSINTDSGGVSQSELAGQAAVAVRYGLPWDVALRAVTIEPAVAIGMGDRLGSLEPGKQADIVAWTGDPLDPRQHVLLVVGGKQGVVLDQRDPQGVRRW